MQLETMRLFCNVVRSQSFSRGAEESGVTQSAASQAVAHLEEDLGARLLDRSKRPFTLTPEGEKVFRTFQSLLDGFDRVCEEIAGDRAKVTGVVRVAAIYSVGLLDMGAQMSRFRNLYPDARIRLECLHPEAVVRAVLDDMTDLGILSYPPARRGLKILPLREEPMSLVVPPGHRFSRRRKLACAELHGEAFVAFDDDLAIRKAIDKALRQKGARLDVILAFDNIESIKKAVAEGTGVSILPLAAVEKEVAMGVLRAVSLDVVLSRPLAIIHRRKKALSPAASRLIEMLRDRS